MFTFRNCHFQHLGPTPKFAVGETISLPFTVQGNFRLDVEAGEFTDSEILVMLGENGTGKTTFIRMIAGLTPPDDDEGAVDLPEFNVSYKPQKISPKFPGTVSISHA